MVMLVMFDFRSMRNGETGGGMDKVSLEVGRLL